MTSRIPKNLVSYIVFLYFMIHLWLLIVPIYQDGNKKLMLLDFLAKPFSPEETKSIFTDRQKETLDAIDDVNELYTKHGYDNISNFMRGISAAETQTGKLQSSVSYSPFQIDPIRYEDIVLRTQDDPLTPNIIEGGAAKERADIANEYLRDVY